MNTDRSLIFAYLEEDNVQRAYFRVRPLLTLEGDVREEAVQLWPNEGGLRIVPDRNEQHVFKGRMRTLGSYCVVDLRNQPAEAGKIRTNKNFKPERGEVNQYILYSDTVRALPENTFYQLLDGAASDYASLAEKAVTPLFYIRDNETLYGPVRKDAPAEPETAKEAAGMLYELPCPDEVTRMMLCMDDEPATEVPAEAPAEEAAAEEPAEPIVRDETATAQESPAVEEALLPEKAAVAEEAPASEPAADPEVQPAPEAEEPAPVKGTKKPAKKETSESLPIGETLHILDERQGHEDTLKNLDKPVSSGANLLRQKDSFQASAPTANRRNEPLSGTPLVRTPLHVSVQQNKNRTQEIVNNQWAVGKYEPPAQNLPVGTAMRAVSNPVEAACAHLRDAWNASSAHEQLMDCILSLEGIRTQLESRLCNGSTETIMQRVLRQRLQDLEAERLAALCELDKAKRDVDAYKQELSTSIAARITRETSKLESDKQSIETHVNALKTELNALTLQRDALQAKVAELQNDLLPEAVAKLMAEVQMSAPVSGTPLRISPVSGKAADLDVLIARVQNICAVSGYAIDRNVAICLLVLLAVSPRIGISSPTPAPAATLVKNMVTAMGWQNGFAHQVAAEQQPLLGARPVDSTPALLMTSLQNYAPIGNATKLMLSRNTSNLIRNAAYDVNQWPIVMLPALPFIPDCEEEDADAISEDSIRKLAEVKVNTAALDAVLSPILDAAAPLSGTARKELYLFVAICADLMDGGLPVAVDWGILLWIVPTLDKNSRHHNAVKTLLDEYPISLAKL